MSDAALAWIAALNARGVGVQARGKHIAVVPKSAYNATLTNEERAFAKQHKAAILDLLRERYNGTAWADVVPAPQTREGTLPSSQAQAAPAPPPPPCRWCSRTPCIGPEHPAFNDLHPHAPPKPTYDLAALRRSDAGLLVTDALTRGETPDDDPDAVMLYQLGQRWRR